jgi:hypothetical protein
MVLVRGIMVPVWNHVVDYVRQREELTAEIKALRAARAPAPASAPLQD